MQRCAQMSKGIALVESWRRMIFKDVACTVEYSCLFVWYCVDSSHPLDCSLEEENWLENALVNYHSRLMNLFVMNK